LLPRRQEEPTRDPFPQTPSAHCCVGQGSRRGGAPRSRSCDELEALIPQHLRIATAILYVVLAGEPAAALGLL